MKIYFAGSIKGGRADVELYKQLVEYLSTFGEVLTEHVANDQHVSTREQEKSDEQIYTQDVKWLLQSDVVIAEVTTPSLGVGYELGMAVEKKKRVLCLYRPQEGKRLSCMIAGCPNVKTVTYHTLEDAKRAIKKLLEN